MKKYAIAIGLFCFVSLTGCITSSETTPSTSTDSTAETTEATSEAPSPSTPAPTPAVAVSAYSSDELFAAGGGGCGMSLLAPETDFNADGLLFFNTFNGSDESTAFMKLDDELSQLTRTAASGEAFYGQKTSQSFETADGAIAVDVEVTLGEPGEIESVAISEGTLTVTAEGQSEEIAVVGNAGC